MHWGTFILTDEPIEEPRVTLGRVLSERGLPKDFFTAPKPGKILKLQQKRE
jgi:N-acyl-phosphatidylethanolamine-hydrolysing phospholipase D